MAERGSLDALPTSTLGQYRVRGRIGSGGMGDVYDAVHTALDKRVAIKTLRRRYLEDEVVVARFLREGQLASRMRHPHIVDVTDVGVIDGLPCLVMEHLEGETLGQVIKRDGALKISTLVDLLLPIIAAVDFAHDHGVLHRDLKPSNIFLARSWNGEVHPKVLDFGISKLVHESSEAALTTDSAFVGTPHYASPESVRAERAADRRSDQYSMGVILYEGSLGVRPFADKGGSFVTMAMAICAGDYRSPRTVSPSHPEAFERVIKQAMSLDADDRFIGMRQLGAALLPFASERARVIWAPAFRGDGTTENVVNNPETQVLRSEMTSVMPNPLSGSLPGAPAASHPSLRFAAGDPRTGPTSMPAWAASSGAAGGAAGLPSVHPYSVPPGGPSSATPAPSVMSHIAASGHHHVPMGMHDRTPSFGAGVNSPISAALPPKKSPAALIAIVAMALAAVAIVAASRAGLFGRGRATGGDPTASDPVTGSTQATGPFSIDVQSSPDNAIFELDGIVAGNGHLTKQLARDGQKHMLRLSAPGYETLLVQFDDTRPPPAIVALRASPQAAGSATGVSTSTRPTTPPRDAVPPNPGNPHPAPPAKGKSPDRPRTDNIDPWE